MRSLLAKVHGNLFVLLVLILASYAAGGRAGLSRGILVAFALLLCVVWIWTPKEILSSLVAVKRRFDSRARDERYWNAFMPAFVPILGGISAAGLWPSLGADVTTDFFSVMAQIIPVLFLAGLVQIASLRQYVHSDDEVSLLRLLIWGLTLGALEGETLALYSLASSTASAFLVAASALALFLQFASLVAIIVLSLEDAA